MNLRAILYKGWTAVTTDYGRSSFITPHGVMRVDRFLSCLTDTPDINRISIRPPRNEDEWSWEVSHNFIVED